MTGSEGRGYWGRILHVDLSSGEVVHEELPDELYRRFLGGVGLAARVLWERIPPGADPWGPDNVLGFVPGLLTDTRSLFTGRFLVVGKSPVTGGWGDSNCGGFFSPWLKRCRIDGLFIRGVASEPVVLVVDEQGARIEPAGDLWGEDTVRTEEILQERHGKVQVACIGPAGENRSPLAGVCNDGGRIAARGGLGGVMGAKRLKAVVAAGRTRVGVVEPERMKALSRDFKGRIATRSPLNRFLGDFLLGRVGWMNRASPLLTRQPADLWRLLLAKFGTPSLTAMSAESGDSPIKNWGGVGMVDFPLRRSQRIGAQAVVGHQVRRYGCYACPLRCGGIVAVEGGLHPIEEMHKPEYETLCAFGSMLLVDDLHALFAINDLCNRAGIDTISAGAVVAFATECFQAGLLTIEDTGGIALDWGDGEAALELLRRIVHREGIGDVLARGVRAAADHVGGDAARFAVHVGGMEVPMHDPKFDPGQLPAYVCDPTPGRHTVAARQYVELQNLERQFDRAQAPPAVSTRKARSDPAGKGEVIAVDTFYKMLVDAAGACLFGTQVGGDIPLVDWMNAATGWDRSPDDYLRAGERIHQLRHAFNVREGLNPIRDHRPHPRVVGDPPQERGPARGLTLDTEGFCREYYGAMRWDPDDGRPAREHLAELDLPEVEDVLYGSPD